MFQKIKLGLQLWHNMGSRYMLFRIGYLIQSKTGLLKLKFPANKSISLNYELEHWKKTCGHFFQKDFNRIKSISLSENDKKQIAIQAQRIRNGDVYFFSAKWFELGLNYDWITNPDTGYKYDINKHWTKIEDYNPAIGDIKYVWEKSRFNFVTHLLRDEIHNGQDHAAFILDQIIHWIDCNPVNRGPNWKCSQEISIRLMHWVMVLFYYQNHKVLTEEKFQKIIHSIYWQTHHVYHNIHFSRIAVRNNHALTETLWLYLAGIFFPTIPNFQHWKSKGKQWFEKEIAYQIYEDGTFLQFSMNYHRVVIQLFSWAITIAEANGEKWKEVVYEKAYKSVNFLYQCQEGNAGELPNYGANDGALFFQLSSSEFRDYRPQLNALHQLLTGKTLYEQIGNWSEDALWFNADKLSFHLYPPLQKQIGCIRFDEGGYYILRDSQTMTFIRCGNHKDRPSQADNLHMDVWVNGENILVDGGSYKYNTDTATLKYFMGTASHNTVMIDEYDQMKKGGRFIWYYWTQQNSSVELNESDNELLFVGSIKAFRHLNKNIVHARKVVKKKNQLQWIIKDEVWGVPKEYKCKQIWHIVPSELETNFYNDQQISGVNKNAYHSPLYGVTKTLSLYEFNFNNSALTTTININ